MASANLIVSTTSNNEAMNRAVKQVAVAYLSGREITEGGYGNAGRQDDGLGPAAAVTLIRRRIGECLERPR